MLEYEWGNPSTVMLPGDEPNQDSDHSRQIFDHYAQAFDDTLVNSAGFAQTHHLFHQPQAYHSQTQTQNQNQNQNHFHSIYDPRAFGLSYPPPSPAMLSLDAVGEGGGGGGSSGFMVVPKSEPGGAGVDFASRIGLNLGGRTYFSSSEYDFVNRLYRRSRPSDPGSMNSPRCQAEGCTADLTLAKHYHRRHKVCEFHSKSPTVIAAGMTQRFCQQCSRFHLLSEFDNGKRSCRKRLADHNRRRRKSHNQHKHEPNSQHENARTPSSEKPARSPSDSGAHSSSSVTVAISPPRMSLDCFRQRSYQTAAATTSSPLTSSLFFSNG